MLMTAKLPDWEPKPRLPWGHDLQNVPFGAVFPGNHAKGIDKARSLARLLEVLGLDREQMNSLRRRLQ